MKKLLILLIASFVINTCISQKLVSYKTGKRSNKYLNETFIKADSFFFQAGIITADMVVGFEDVEVNITKPSNYGNQVYIVKYDLDYKIIWTTTIDKSKTVESVRIKYNNGYLFVFWDEKLDDKYEYNGIRVSILDPEESAFVYEFKSGLKKVEYAIDISNDGKVGVTGTYKDFVDFPYMFQTGPKFNCTSKQDVFVFSTGNGKSYIHNIRHIYCYPADNVRDFLAINFDIDNNLNLFGYYESSLQLDLGNTNLKGKSEFQISFNEDGELNTIKSISSNTFALRSKIEKLNNLGNGYISLPNHYKYISTPYKFVFLDENLKITSSVDLPITGRNDIIDAKLNKSSISILFLMPGDQYYLKVNDTKYISTGIDYAIVNLDFQGNVNWLSFFGADNINNSSYPISLNYLDNGNIIITGVTFGGIDIDPSRKKVIALTTGNTFYVSEYNNECNNLMLSLENLKNVSCNSNGNVKFNTVGGTKPLKLFFQDVESEFNTNLPINETGVYEAYVIDDEGCSKSIYVPISGPSDNDENDMDLLVYGGRFRTGFKENIYVYLRNETCNMKSGTIKIKLDKDLEYTNSSIQPIEVNGQTLLFEYDSLIYGMKEFKVNIEVLVDDKVQFGEQLCCPIYINDENGIEINNDIFCSSVFNSFDPNDMKVAPFGRCDENYFLQSEYLEYQLRFQNLGNAEAINIEIVDTLNQYLDISTLEVIKSSHDLIPYIENDSVLILKYSNINLPAKSQNELESEGFVVFRIKSKEITPINTEIYNKASIYFDFNDPVVTNKVRSTLINSLPDCIITNTNEVPSLIKIFPNPVTNILNIEFIDNAEHKVSLYNIYGEIILRNLERSSTRLSIDLSNEDSGIYFIKIDNTIHKILKI